MTYFLFLVPHIDLLGKKDEFEGFSSIDYLKLLGALLDRYEKYTYIIIRSGVLLFISYGLQCFK